MAPSIITERAALKVFGIPELAHLICSTIQKGDNVSLMRVCRQLFHDILPFVWENVDEANTLVSMIPGGGITTYDSDWSPYEVMQPPDSLDLTRFKIYAPHVKRFTPSALHVDEYNGWERFLLCAQSVDLLPNLETLCLPALDNTRYTHNRNRTIEADTVKWITAFLSTSLQTLELVPPEMRSFSEDGLWLNLPLFHGLMKSVSQKCLHLRSLSILPANITQEDLTSRRGPTLPCQVSFSCDFLKIPLNFLQFKDLSSLLISPVILSPEALVALSGLPGLETFRIVGHKNDGQIYCDHLELPINAFPCLKHLELIRITWRNIGNVCKARPLVAGLHSLKITYPSYPKGCSADAQFTNLGDIIPLLAASSSVISSLSVCNFGYYRVLPNVLQPWKQLPLINLHLGCSVNRYDGFDALCSILSSFPTLENLELRMTQNSFYLTQLKTMMGNLPRLRRIQVSVRWESTNRLIERDFTPSLSRSSQTLHVKSNFYLPEPQQENAGKLARYLSSLRPLAPVFCEAYPYSAIGYTNEGPKNMINTELARLRLG